MLLILVVAMATFWQELTGETYGASFEKVAQSRTQHLAAAREHEAGLSAAAQLQTGGDSGLVAEKADGRATRFHENEGQILSTF